jgi:hypothetical protein
MILFSVMGRPVEKQLISLKRFPLKLFFERKFNLILSFYNIKTFSKSLL